GASIAASALAAGTATSGADGGIDRAGSDAGATGRSGRPRSDLFGNLRADTGTRKLVVVRLSVAVRRQRLLLLPLPARPDARATPGAGAESADWRPSLAWRRAAHLSSGGGLSASRTSFSTDANERRTGVGRAAPST